MKKARVFEILRTNFILCIHELLSNKTRSFITSFGILLGVASLLTIISFVRAMDNDLKKNISELGGVNILSVAIQQPKTKQEKFLFARSTGNTLSQMRQIAESIPNIKTLLPQKKLGWFPVIFGGKRVFGNLTAVSEAHCEAYNYKIHSGRIFNSEDFSKKAPVCIVGSQIANGLFGQNIYVQGKRLIIRNIPFTIIGTINTDTKYDERAYEVLFPYSFYESQFSGKFEKIAEIALKVGNTENILSVKHDLNNALLSAHRGVKDFHISANQDKIKEMKSASTGMNILLFSIAIISLLVAGISIMNIMFATIGDRIKEIGIRKALGAHNADVFTQFLIESILLCSVGGLLGIFIGTATTFFPKETFPFYPVLISTDYFLAIMFIMIVGIMSGLFPALRAAKMQPVEALRY